MTDIDYLKENWRLAAIASGQRAVLWSPNIEKTLRLFLEAHDKKKEAAHAKKLKEVYNERAYQCGVYARKIKQKLEAKHAEEIDKLLNALEGMMLGKLPYDDWDSEDIDNLRKELKRVKN